MKILPELQKSVEFGGGGPNALNMVLKIASKLSSDDFESKAQPFIVRLFGNPDRALRVCLLDGLPLMIDRLPQKIVNDKIFPQAVRGPGLPLMKETNLITGHWFHGCSPCCSGTDAQIGPRFHSQAV